MGQFGLTPRARLRIRWPRGCPLGVAPHRLQRDPSGMPTALSDARLRCFMHARMATQLQACDRSVAERTAEWTAVRRMCARRSGSPVARSRSTAALRQAFEAYSAFLEGRPYRGLRTHGALVRRCLQRVEGVSKRNTKLADRQRNAPGNAARTQRQSRGIQCVARIRGTARHRVRAYRRC
jgi:hypothetical protein